MVKEIEFTNKMDEDALIAMMEKYLSKARLNLHGERIEAIKRIKSICEGILK